MTDPRPELLDDLDATIAATTRLRDALVSQVTELNESIGNLSSLRYGIWSGLMADRAEQTSSRPAAQRGFVDLPGLADIA